MQPMRSLTFIPKVWKWLVADMARFANCTKAFTISFFAIICTVLDACECRHARRKRDRIMDSPRQFVNSGGGCLVLATIIFGGEVLVPARTIWFVCALCKIVHIVQWSTYTYVIPMSSSEVQAEENGGNKTYEFLCNLSDIGKRDVPKIETDRYLNLLKVVG